MMDQELGQGAPSAGADAPRRAFDREGRETVIEVKGLRKAFGDKAVLAGIDFDVVKGESLVIIGGSGTGKSVTLKCILGLLEPDDGEIWVSGEQVDRRPRGEALLSRFGMLFQGAALFDSLPVWRNVAFRLLQTREKSAAECRDLAIEKLRLVSLSPETADLYPAELSGGMQKRVGLARAIAAEPEIIFFDEPTTGLDPIRSGQINLLIRRLVSQLGATAITITHDMSSVRAIADRVLMLHDGLVRWVGPAEQIDESGDAHLLQFISGAADGPIDPLR